ncbi:hypothetical protein Tco_1009882, partial [Tanacetum coccineum]
MIRSIALSLMVLGDGLLIGYQDFLLLLNYRFGLRIVVAATSYYIWMEKNGRLFKKKTSSPDQIIEVILSMVRLKLVTFKFKKMSTRSLLLLDQWKIPRNCIIHDRSTGQSHLDHICSHYVAACLLDVRLPSCFHHGLFLGDRLRNGALWLYNDWLYLMLFLISADVARGHGDDGGSDDRPPPEPCPSHSKCSNQAKSTVICQQRSQSLAVLRDMQMESFATQEYPSLIQIYFDTHTVDGVFLRDEERLLYMLRLKDLGPNTPSGVPYTDNEIMAMVHRGKQRGHIPGVGSVLAGQGRDLLA